MLLLKASNGRNVALEIIQESILANHLMLHLKDAHFMPPKGEVFYFQKYLHQAVSIYTTI